MLFYYEEWQYINNIKKENIISAGTFCETFITINNENFEKKNNIYPAALELKKENQIIEILIIEFTDSRPHVSRVF